MFFAGPERRIAGRVRQFPFWYFRRALFWFGVHNWTELRREKLHSAGMEYDPTQEMDHGGSFGRLSQTVILPRLSSRWALLSTQVTPPSPLDVLGRFARELTVAAARGS
jgi:hypothetical protein